MTELGNGLKTLKENYWKLIARTRKSGRVSSNVIRKEEEYWRNFDEDVVMEALSVHIRKYPEYKENYTRGIMRNMQRQKQATGKLRKENMYNRFQQREYDYDALEKELLGV